MKITGSKLLPRQAAETPVNNFTFNLYLLYIISYFLHLSARIPGLAVLRPDLVMAVCLIIMLFLQQNKLTGRLDSPCNHYLNIFMFYVIISLPFVEFPGSVLRENLFDFIKTYLFFHFTVLIVDTDLRLKRFVSVFMACQLFRVLEPLYLHEMYGYWGSATYLSSGEFAARLGGAPTDVINPNGLALVIATLFPFLHYIWGNSRWMGKIAYLSLVPTLLYALVLTMSRSGFVAMLVIAGNIFVKSRQKFVLIIVGGIIATLAWNNMNDIQKDRYLSLTGADDLQSSATFQGRVSGIGAEVRVALHRPIFGHGLGTSREAKYNVGVGAQISHNLYIETFIETGIIGLIIIILFLISIYNTLKQSGVNLTEIYELNKKNINVQTKTTINICKYEKNFLMALKACFWMYIIFSIAQYGLREYHWFFIAGLATVLNRRTRHKKQLLTTPSYNAINDNRTLN